MYLKLCIFSTLIVYKVNMFSALQKAERYLYFMWKVVEKLLQNNKAPNLVDKSDALCFSLKMRGTM